MFQSSTVGVLLADPTQAKVKVKYEGKAAGEPDDDTEQNDVSISCLFDIKTGVIKSICKLTLKVLDAHLSSVVRLSICTYISAYKIFLTFFLPIIGFMNLLQPQKYFLYYELYTHGPSGRYKYLNLRNHKVVIFNRFKSFFFTIAKFNHVIIGAVFTKCLMSLFFYVLISKIFRYYFAQYQSDAEPQLQFGSKEAPISNLQVKSQYDRERSGKSKTTGVREDKGKDLGSLGYAMAEPVDWIRIQLPKKQDLFQEFYRRIHNYV